MNVALEVGLRSALLREGLSKVEHIIVLKKMIIMLIIDTVSIISSNSHHNFSQRAAQLF